MSETNFKWGGPGTTGPASGGDPDCCNLSGGVALDAWFTTNGMCAKNNNIYAWREQAIIEWLRRGISVDTKWWTIEQNGQRTLRGIAPHDLYCCLLPQCEALRTCRSDFPIAILPFSTPYHIVCADAYLRLARGYFRFYPPATNHKWASEQLVVFNLTFSLHRQKRTERFSTAFCFCTDLCQRQPTALAMFKRSNFIRFARAILPHGTRCLTFVLETFENYSKQTLALRQASEESACFLLSFFCDD